MSGNMFFDVIWCPEGPGTSWEWFSMNLGSFIHFSIFLIFSHFEWLVFGVSSGLLHVVWCLVHLGFDIKINVWNDWQVFPAYSISDFVNLQSVVPLWSWHLLPLTQNTLPSKDVREYVFWCYLMPWQGPPGKDQSFISEIFSFFSFWVAGTRGLQWAALFPDIFIW